MCPTAYTGLIAFEGQYVNGTLNIDYREYIQCRLLQPLQAGRQYCVSFHLSPTIGPTGNFNYVALDNIGVNFSATQPVSTSGYTLTLPTQVTSTPGVFFSDTTTWYKISTVFTATGGEEWLTIGCFKNNGGIPGLQQVYPATPDPNYPQRSYIYLDDISVSKVLPSDTTRYVHDTTICTSGAFAYTIQVAQGDAYTWNNGVTAQQQTLNDTGTYWCVTRAGCNTHIDTFRIHSRKYTPLQLGKDTVNCQNQPVILQAATGYSTYQWSTGSTANTITATQSGSYILTVSDACGLQTDSVRVTIQPPTPVPAVHDTTICQYTDDPQLGITGANLHWYHYLYEPNAMLTQPVIFATTVGTQTLYVSQKIGACESQRVPVNINVRYKPKADIGDYISLCERDTTSIGKAYNDVAYAWSSGENTCCIHPDHTGPYTFSIYNDCGISTDSVFVDINPCDNCAVIPNAFTPNNDGRNDRFQVLMTCPVTRYQLRIYNRWGQQIFSTGDPSAGWDGVVNGVVADKGVYVYIVEYESEHTGRGHFLKGNVTLVK
jgi:gliding motility-associated-like protein